MSSVKRYWYQDPWNENKKWEVVKLVGGWYLRQYVCGSQVNRGVRASKKFIESIGILDYELLTVE